MRLTSRSACAIKVPQNLLTQPFEVSVSNHEPDSNFTIPHHQLTFQYAP
jgi:hypothetical protein